MLVVGLSSHDKWLIIIYIPMYNLFIFLNIPNVTLNTQGKKSSPLADAFKVESLFFLDVPSEMSNEYNILGMVHGER